MKNQSKNYKQIVLYTYFNMMGQCFRVAQEFLLRKVLNQYDIGIWSLALTMQSLVAGVDLGLLTASTRVLPHLYDKADQPAIFKMQSTVLILQFAQRIVGAVLVFCYFLCLYSHKEQKVLWIIGGVLFAFSIATIAEALISFYQAAQQFTVLGKIQFFYWFLVFILIVPLAYQYGIYGLLIATIVAAALQVFLLKGALLSFRVANNIDYKMAKDLFTFSLPFRIIDLPQALLPAMDNIVIAKIMGLKILAIYATAKLIASQAAQVPTWISGAFIIRLTQLLHNGEKEKEHASELYKNLLFQYLMVLPTVIVSTYSLTVLIVHLFLPQYESVIPILKVLLISIYFQPSITIIRNIWIVRSNFKIIGIVNMAAFLFMCIGLYWASSQKDIMEYAYVYLACFFFYFSLKMILLNASMGGWRKCLRVYLSALISIAIIVISIDILNNAALTDGSMIKQFFLMILVVATSASFCFGFFKLLYVKE